MAARSYVSRLRDAFDVVPDPGLSKEDRVTALEALQPAEDEWLGDDVAVVSVTGAGVEFEFGPGAQISPQQVPETLVLLIDACFRLLCDSNHWAVSSRDYAPAWATIVRHILHTVDGTEEGCAAITDDCVRRVWDAMILEAVTILADRTADPPISPCFALAFAVRQGLEHTRLRLDTGLQSMEVLHDRIELMRRMLERM
jgi:hypothetical protein